MPNPVQLFLDRIGQRDIAGALTFVAEDVVFEPQGPNSLPIYGRFEGRAGVQQLFGILSEIFETEVFEVRHWGEAPGLVFAHGFMQHRVRKTGRRFKSEWALVVQVRDGLIHSWKIFEDTAAFQAAYA